MPAEEAQLEQVGGDTDRYDAELRPELMRRTIEEFQDAGIEVDIWKIEGIDTQEDCEMIAAAAPPRRPRRRDVRGARPRRERREGGAVAHAGAPVEGYAGFAIGRTIWWDALKGFLDGVARARGRSRADRQQLPAFRRRLQARSEREPAAHKRW